MKATVTVKSYIDKEKLIREYSDEMIDEIRKRIQFRAKVYVPVDTGKLKRSIRLIQKYTVGSTVRYAGYVEEGTRYMRAQPYMQPAIEDVMRTLPAISRQEFRDAERKARR